MRVGANADLALIKKSWRGVLQTEVRQADGWHRFVGDAPDGGPRQLTGLFDTMTS